MVIFQCRLNTFNLMTKLCISLEIHVASVFQVLTEYTKIHFLLFTPVRFIEFKPTSETIYMYFHITINLFWF